MSFVIPRTLYKAWGLSYVFLIFDSKKKKKILPLHSDTATNNSLAPNNREKASSAVEIP